MDSGLNIIVEEYVTPTNKNAKINIDTLISRFKNRNSTIVILKGTRLYNGKSSIVYLVSKDENCSILENAYREGSKANLKITKRNNVKNSYFEFSVWCIMRIGKGQLTGSNMNMLNDNENYKCYKVI